MPPKGPTESTCWKRAPGAALDGGRGVKELPTTSLGPSHRGKKALVERIRATAGRPVRRVSPPEGFQADRVTARPG